MSWIARLSAPAPMGLLARRTSALSSRLSPRGLANGPTTRRAGGGPGGGAIAPRCLATTTVSEGVPDIGVRATAGRPRICILGGGFGGLYTAVRLEGLMWPQGQRPAITLIDQNERFVFKPMLYELLSDAVNEWEVAPEYTALLAPYSVQHICSRVAQVRPERTTQDGGSAGGGTVLLEGGAEVPYDWLVLALGAETNTAMAEGAREHAIAFATLDDAKRTKAAIEVIERRASGRPATRPATISIVGAGYAGVELAAMLAERLGSTASVQVVTPGDQILPGAAPGLVQAAGEQLARLGVSLRLGTTVTRLQGAGDAWPGSSDMGKVVEVRRSDGGLQTEHADLVLWTAGQVPAAASQGGKARKGFPFPTSVKGYTETDPTLRVVGHSHVFAIGDAAAQASGAGGGAPLPATAQVAFQQADYVAWNLWASIHRRPLLTFRYQNLGTMMSLGKASGAVALNVPVPQGIAAGIKASPLGSLLSIAGVEVDDGANGLTVKGPLGAAVRRAAYWYRQPTDDHRARVGASWAQGGASELQNILSKLSPPRPATSA